MAHLFTVSELTTLSLNLEDGSSTQFPQALVFTNGSLDTTVSLGHVGLGRYAGLWTPPSAFTYDVLYIVYTDALHTFESSVYTRVMEKWQPDTIFPDAIDVSNLPVSVADQVWDELLVAHTTAGSSGEFLARMTQAHIDNTTDINVRMRLVEKILRNKLELADGDSGNWILFDDDSVTPLLTWSVVDKDGDAITQPKLVPSSRTRGV